MWGFDSNLFYAALNSRDSSTTSVKATSCVKVLRISLSVYTPQRDRVDWKKETNYIKHEIDFIKHPKKGLSKMIIIFTLSWQDNSSVLYGRKAV